VGRIRYEIDLKIPLDDSALDSSQTRSIERDDLGDLAQLMLDAYIGTIDYEGENLDEAAAEVRSFFDGDPMLDHSFLVEVEERIVSAILIVNHNEGPLVRTVMTLPEYKRKGLARVVTSRTLVSLAAQGYTKLVLYITEGNQASEALFKSLGAVHIPTR
jgi:predicted GNAT family acetyltransferase